MWADEGETPGDLAFDSVGFAVNCAHQFGGALAFGIDGGWIELVGSSRVFLG
jgi:hypothetical protein